MFLFAVAIGALFAWLVERVGGRWDAQWLLAELSRPAKASTPARKVVDLLGFLLLSAGVFALYCALDGLYTGNHGWLTRLFYFAGLPAQATVISGFVLGAGAFWLRGAIKKVYRLALKMLWTDARKAQAAAQEGEKLQARPAARHQQASDEKHARPWLSGVLGSAAAILIAAIIAVVFFPDVIRRMEFVSVAGIEARFAATASSTIRVQAQSENFGSVYHYALGKWQNVGDLFKERVEPVRRKFAASEATGRAKTLAQLQSDNATKDVEEMTRRLLVELAAPLSQVMSCFAREYNIMRHPAISDSQVSGNPLQIKSTELAQKWGRFALFVGREAAAIQGDPLLKAVYAERWRSHLEALMQELVSFITGIDAHLFETQARCGFVAEGATAYGTDEQGTPKPDVRRDQRYFAKQHAERAKLLEYAGDRLPGALANGYVIAFLADKMTSAQGVEKALEFMNAMADHLDTSDAAITGKLTFDVSRANLYYYQEPWDFREWLKHAHIARATADKINRQLTGYAFADGKCAASNDRLGRYYCWLAARSVNDIIYGHVRDWMNGRRINAKEKLDLEGLSNQLKTWLSAQSYSDLLNQRGANGEMSASSRAVLVANGYDTLGLYEFMIGADKSDLTKDRCGLIWSYIGLHQHIWDTLWNDRKGVDRQSFADVYRDASQVNRAHRLLVDSACPR